MNQTWKTGDRVIWRGRLAEVVRVKRTKAEVKLLGSFTRDFDAREATRTITLNPDDPIDLVTQLMNIDTRYRSAPLLYFAYTNGNPIEDVYLRDLEETTPEIDAAIQDAVLNPRDYWGHILAQATNRSTP